MDTNAQTEREVVDNEAGFLSRDFYREQICGLSHLALLEECLRQYDLSGETLGKYRDQSQKKDDARKQVNSYRQAHMLLSNALALLQRDLSDMRTELDSVQVMIDQSEGYTHSMKRTVFKMISGVVKKSSNRLVDLAAHCKDEMENSWSRVSEKKSTQDENPF